METILIEKEISGYIGRLLRESFGRGPKAVYSTYSDPFIVVHITGFMSPVEKSLIDCQQTLYVEKTRDVIMDGLMDEVKAFLEITLERKVDDFYYDWNLEEQSGAFIITLSPEAPEALTGGYAGKTHVHHEMAEVSIEAQKMPEEIDSSILSRRVLLLIRKGILVQIEKELIHLGFEETLTLAKRRLEKRKLKEHQGNFEKHLQKNIAEVFVDWNFDKDLSYSVFIFKPE
ncbi:Na-translocating system protein MpsC family protein [Bacillus sp. B-jedd]|uniref:Na-translocating system protein MpsC family protein n=1 Tax=Bacillus sp. B-jedd TaxID=1476857 RepID=UPI0005156C2F|nr:Na-translocating system protein MpsC family protein [Bacillus sp. B-jedd]CEG27268.1 hypothetical protein BN1002_02125 [Bacillus sp. B-jedd]